LVGVQGEGLFAIWSSPSRNKYSVKPSIYGRRNGRSSVSSHRPLVLPGFCRPGRSPAKRAWRSVG